MRRRLYVWIRYVAAAMALVVSPLGVEAAFAQTECGEIWHVTLSLEMWLWVFYSLADWTNASILEWMLQTFLEVQQMMGC